MKRIANISAGVILSALSFVSVTARAQDAPIMALDPTLMAGWSGNLAYDSKVAGKTVATAKSSFDYTSTPALRQRVVSNFVKRLQSRTSQGANAVNSTFGPGKADYNAIYGQILKSSSLKINNAADALTGLMLVGYQVVNNVPGSEVNSAMESGAQAQMIATLSKNAKLKSELVRAQMAEQMKLQSVVLVLGLQEATKTNTQEAYRQSIASMFQQQYGINLKQIKLTNQGFAKK
ncbi:hypothetical protein [Mucilaginibacter sp. CSA2-8R]|uniref:hypothetical protein n=1 Tax=Mucilaginibacter sp. CSA2-8R TaxID=3141542 RepID=UPI00315CB33E